jgi:hypothetical protein
MTAQDVVVVVAFVLLSFSLVIFVRWILRDIGWYRAGLEVEAVKKQRERDRAVEAALSRRDAELREWRKNW